MTEELQASTKTAVSVQLSAWEVRRVQEKLNKRKYRYGQGHMLVAFACPQLRQGDGDQVGKPFRMDDPRHGSKVIGQVFHVFRERGIAVVDVTEPVLQAWVRTCLIPDTGASGENLPEVPQEPSPGGVPVDQPQQSSHTEQICWECMGNGFTEPSVPCWKCGGSGKLPIGEVMP